MMFSNALPLKKKRYRKELYPYAAYVKGSAMMQGNISIRENF
jgi:hypothetical protein